MLRSVGDKNPQISLSRGVVLAQSTFHLVIVVTTYAVDCPVALEATLHRLASVSGRVEMCFARLADSTLDRFTTTSLQLRRHLRLCDGPVGRTTARGSRQGQRPAAVRGRSTSNSSRFSRRRHRRLFRPRLDSAVET